MPLQADTIDDLRSRIHGHYERWAPRSAALAAEARRSFPGGDTRMSAHYAPHPLFIDSAEGSRVRDVDGHELVDFMNNFTSLILGHADREVVRAVSEQVARGSAVGAATTSQLELAEILRSRIPSMEQLRFTASGSEATLMTIRCARASTGRSKIMKMEGGYHGSYELAEASLVPLPGLAGPANAPNVVPVDASHSPSLEHDVLVCPYNQPEAAAALIAQHASELAAVIVEPVLGSMGMIPASREFLQTLRDATATHDVVLILDEVITFRLGVGGAQAVYGITPDLTALGKIIGGGLPIGAFGGREDLMRVFHPGERRPVMHSSTFSGNPLSMAAGAATMQRVDAELIDRLGVLGQRLRAGFDRAFERAGVRGRATGVGSLTNLHLSDAPIADARDALQGMIGAGAVGGLLHLLLLERGVFASSRLMYSTSSPMTESDVDHAVSALEDALAELVPALRQVAPRLLT